MKVTSIAKVTVLKRVEKKGITDPSKTFYSLLVMQDSDCGAISCTKDVSEAVVEGNIASLVMTYGEGNNGGYIRATGVVTAKVEK